MPPADTPARPTRLEPGFIYIRATGRTIKHWRSLIDLGNRHGLTANQMISSAIRLQRERMRRTLGPAEPLAPAPAPSSKAPPRGAKKNRPRVD